MSPTSTSPTRPPRQRTAGVRIGAGWLWFAVLGGMLAWGAHLLLAWSSLELTCLTSRPGAGVYLFIGLVTGVPFLVAVGAAVTALVLRSRLSRLEADPLAAGRTALMVTIAIVLDLLMIAAIIGDGIAVLVLEPC